MMAMTMKERIETHNNYAIETVVMGPGDHNGFYMERAIELCCEANEYYESTDWCVDRCSCCVVRKDTCEFPDEKCCDGKPRYMTFCWA